MSMSDPIADMLTRIRNAQLARKKNVKMPNSRIKISIAKVLKDEGYIDDFSVKNIDNKSILDISLKYYCGSPTLSGMAAGILPEKPVLLWTFKTAGAVKSSAAIVNTPPSDPLLFLRTPRNRLRGRQRKDHKATQSPEPQHLLPMRGQGRPRNPEIPYSQANAGNEGGNYPREQSSEAERPS